MVDSPLKLVTGVLHIGSKSETGICELHWGSHLSQFLIFLHRFWQQTTTFNGCVTGHPGILEKCCCVHTWSNSLNNWYRKNPLQRTCSSREAAVAASAVQTLTMQKLPAQGSTLRQIYLRHIYFWLAL